MPGCRCGFRQTDRLINRTGQQYGAGLEFMKASGDNPRGAMARVTFMTQFRDFTDGIASVEVDVRSVQQLIRALSEKFPALAPHLDAGVAFAIDGQLYQDALFQPINEDSDVHILPMLAGG
jgi:sulfur-carrier protein